MPWRTTLLCLLLASHSAQAEIPPFSTVRDWAGETLVRQSQGSAYYAGLFHVYDAALYLPAQAAPSQALEGRIPRCLVLHYRIGLSQAQFVEAASSILQRQQVDIKPIEARVARLHAAYRDVQSGDRYSLCYAPQAGTHLLLNEQPLVRIEGEDFARAYFGIWLAEAPISAALREALLRRAEE